MRTQRRQVPTRRDFLRVGGLGLAGLSLPELLRAEALGRSIGQATAGGPKSCIFIFLYGGPAQLDTFDPKPHAPAEVRGEFKPIATTVPGTLICEHLPQTAQLARHYTIVRSLHHTNRTHNIASGWTLTGVQLESERPPQEDDPPAIGSLATRLAPTHSGVPSFVMLPARLYFDPGVYFRGQAGGWLGHAYDPLLIEQDPNSPSFRLDAFAPRDDVPVERVARRRSLLASLDRELQDRGAVERMGVFQRRALDLLTSRQGRTAFDLSEESDAVRDRYGRTMLGQGCLLARRLIEAGARLVTVSDCSPGGFQQWDTHYRNFPTLKSSLLPRLDQAYSALLEDLLARGLLEDTVVYLGGEFGRTPRVGQTIGSATGGDGRDHWPYCYSGLLAGGLTRPGMVFGASDRNGGYPARDPMTPEDLAATLLRAMGLDPQTILSTRDGRPTPVSTGTVAAGLLA